MTLILSSRQGPSTQIRTKKKMGERLTTSPRSKPSVIIFSRNLWGTKQYTTTMHRAGRLILECTKGARCVRTSPSGPPDSPPHLHGHHHRRHRSRSPHCICMTGANTSWLRHMLNCDGEPAIWMGTGTLPPALATAETECW